MSRTLVAAMVCLLLFGGILPVASGDTWDDSSSSGNNTSLSDLFSSASGESASLDLSQLLTSETLSGIIAFIIGLILSLLGINPS